MNFGRFFSCTKKFVWTTTDLHSSMKCSMMTFYNALDYRKRKVILGYHYGNINPGDLTLTIENNYHVINITVLRADKHVQANVIHPEQYTLYCLPHCVHYICMCLHYGSMRVSWASHQIRKMADEHAPGMSGTFSPSARVSDPDMHPGTCVTHVPGCMPGSLTTAFICNRRRGKMFPAFPVHAQPAILRIC